MKLKLIYLLTAVVVTVGCRRGNYYSDQIDGLDYGQFQTYAWLPLPDTALNKEHSLINNEILVESIRQAVDSEMESRGFEVDVDSPDVLLLIHTMLEDRQELIDASPLYSTYGYYYPGIFTGPMHPFYYDRFYTMPFVEGYGIRQVEYTEGAMVVDMIERDENRLVWRGWMEKRITNPDRLQRNIPEHVAKIFEGFPLEGHEAN
ncbi:DUF4136 domain-containing protein [Cytophagaceae bacterium ABcell3]|nr:DUF4136 domain-containing protein [Cytophagaceae bacterium ABcell3]